MPVWLKSRIEEAIGLLSKNRSFVQMKRKRNSNFCGVVSTKKQTKLKKIKNEECIAENIKTNGKRFFKYIHSRLSRVGLPYARKSQTCPLLGDLHPHLGGGCIL